MAVKDFTDSQIIDFLIDSTTVECKAPTPTEDMVTINSLLRK